VAKLVRYVTSNREIIWALISTMKRKQGLYYPVNFGTRFNVRKYFAPLNGEIKPDTEEVRELLRLSDWLDDDAASESSGSMYTE